MDTQKVENLLLTSFEADSTQREKSTELSASYEAEENKWEVAVRYINDLSKVLAEFEGVDAEFLVGNYAILRGESEALLEIAGRDEVLYMEAAKRLYFSERDDVNYMIPGQHAVGERLKMVQLDGVSGLESICLTREFQGEGPIRGLGVYTAYLDTGIDYRHPEFIDENGRTRIDFIWDQNTENGFYTEEMIQQAIDLPAEEGYEIVPQKDLSGHGTHVAAIGSGNTGVAPGSRLLVVKLGSPKGGGVKTTELMRGINACVNYAVARGKPLALNISYGTNYGSHNGYGILEQFLEDAAGFGRNVFAVGSGNEGVGRSHFQVTIDEIKERRDMAGGGDAFVAELAVGEYQQSFSLQIWKEYQEDLRFYLRPAGSESAVEIRQELRAVTYSFEGMEALVYYGEPSPFSRYQEIYLDFIPEGDFVPEGIWEIYIEAVGGEWNEIFDESEGFEWVQDGRVDMWIPVSETLSPQTGFLRSSPESTLTIPSTSSGVITVGAFDQRFNQYAAFSGRGYTWATVQIKPDIVAPGVEIISASPGGGYTGRTGTSMATPFVTGASALFMEWGIVLGNDSYLYGEKMKAYFIKGAQRLPGIVVYPNAMVGYGSLCIKDSIP